jgi:hypothetical protein
MSKLSFKSEIVTSVILVIILSLFLRPTSLLMPKTAEMMLPIFLIVGFLVFATLFWKERSADERENLHRLNAGRLSFLVGSTILTLGILVQSTRHDVDPWLIYTLVFMILAKVASRIYSQMRN